MYKMQNKNRSEPLISVVMSVYNGEKYLDEAIQSILDQTFTDFEFIIINDGSTDKTLEIIESFIKKDVRIVLVSRENKGLIASLNEGLDLAKGEYIARMDADDISLKNRFEKQIAFLKKRSDVGVCGTWVEFFGENFKTQIWKLPTGDKFLKARLLFSVPFAHPSVMIRKNLLDKYSIHYDKNYKNVEDYKLWVDLHAFTKFENLPLVLLKHRHHSESITRKDELDIFKERFFRVRKIQGELLILMGNRLDDYDSKILFSLKNNKYIKEGVFDLGEVRRVVDYLIVGNNGYFDKNVFKNIVCEKYSLYLLNYFLFNNGVKLELFFDLFFLKGLGLMVTRKLLKLIN